MIILDFPLIPKRGKIGIMQLIVSHSSELEWIRFLHRFRTPLLDELFKCMDFFDRSEFFFILIPLLFVGYHWKAGIKLFYLLFFSASINQGLKLFFSSPRPFHLDASLGLIQINGYGLPSGAAQTAILLVGLLVNSWKRPYKWLIALFYVLLISFSRIYLGVHFPSDIVVGWTTGLLLLLLFIFVEKHLETLSSRTLFLISQLIPVILLCFLPPVFTMQLCPLATGVGIGLFIAHSYRLLLPISRNSREFITRGTIGVLSVLLLQTIAKTLPLAQSQLYAAFTLLFLGIWLGAGSNWLCYALFPHLRK